MKLYAEMDQKMRLVYTGPGRKKLGARETK
jgi:hypothetical protein